MAEDRKRDHGPQRLGHVRWEGYDHRLLWNMIMDARPDDVFDRHYRWVRIGRELVAVNETVQRELNTLFQTWQGTAAMGAALANTRLLQWSQETAETTQRIGEQLGSYGNALVEARKRMPQPRHVHVENEFRAGDGGTVWNGPENAFTLFQLLSDYRATTRERAEAKERAVEVMRAFEADAVQVERRLDTYSEAPNVVRPGPAGGGSPVPGGDDGGSGVELPPLPDADWPTQTGTAGVAGGGSGYGSGGYGAAPYGGVSGATGHGAGAAGYGLGGYGAGGGAAGGGAARGGVPGQALGATNRPAGPLPGQTAATEAAARGGTAAGRGGAMVYPPMAGAPRDDDQEKRVAPYLVGDDDLFDDDRAVAPPVFGG